MGEMSYSVLWQTYQKERQSNELQMVPRSFYEDSKEFVESIDMKASEDAKTLKENAARILNSVFERRRQKVLMYVAYGRPLPSSTPAQDTVLYEEALKLLKSDSVAGTKTSQIVPPLRSVQQIPQIILPSGRKIGPLEKEQLIDVPDKEDTAFLINNGICKQA